MQAGDRRQTTKGTFRDDADLRGVIWRLGRLSPALFGAVAVVECTVGLSTPVPQAREAAWMLGFGAVVAVACGSFGGSFAAFVLTRTSHTDVGRSPRHAQSPHDLLKRDKTTTAVVGLCMFAATFAAAVAAWASTDPRGLTPERDMVAFVITAAIAGATTGPPLLRRGRCSVPRTFTSACADIFPHGTATSSKWRIPGGFCGQKGSRTSSAMY